MTSTDGREVRVILENEANAKGWRVLRMGLVALSVAAANMNF